MTSVTTFNCNNPLAVRSPENQPDLLTALPDELNVRIMSFLPFKDQKSLGKVSRNFHRLEVDEQVQKQALKNLGVRKTTGTCQEELKALFAIKKEERSLAKLIGPMKYQSLPEVTYNTIDGDREDKYHTLETPVVRGLTILGCDSMQVRQRSLRFNVSLTTPNDSNRYPAIIELQYYGTRREPLTLTAYLQQNLKERPLPNQAEDFVDRLLVENPVFAVKEANIGIEFTE